MKIYAASIVYSASGQWLWGYSYDMTWQGLGLEDELYTPVLYPNHQVVTAGDEATELLGRQNVPLCSLYQHKPPQHVHASDSSSTTWLIWARLVFLAALIWDLIISQVYRNFELQTPFALKIHEGQGIVRAAYDCSGVRGHRYPFGKSKKQIACLKDMLYVWFLLYLLIFSCLISTRKSPFLDCGTGYEDFQKYLNSKVQTFQASWYKDKKKKKKIVKKNILNVIFLICPS